MSYKKQQSDSVWVIAIDELQFNQPIEVVGQGAFGVVVLAQYRGTKVAVKRVLPPHVSSKTKDGSRTVQMRGTRAMKSIREA